MKWKKPLAEFVAIFAGVTLSLLADDFREFRNDLGSETSSLQLVLRDLEEDSNQLETALTHPRRHEAWSAWMGQRWDDPDVPEDSVGLAFRAFVHFNSYQFQGSAFRSLSEAGRLSLIRDDSLRAQIVEYFEERQVNVGQFLEILLTTRGEILSQIGPYGTMPPPLNEGTNWPLEPGGIELVDGWGPLQSDRGFRWLIAGHGAMATLTRQYGDGALRANADLRHAILQELSER